MAKKKTNQKCEVSDYGKRCPTCGSKLYGWTCGKKAITKLKDIVCKPLIDKKPFWVCAKHKKEFLKCNKGEQPHYKEVKPK